MPSNLPSPLGGPPPSEVNLPRAPLARVLAVVQFPGILKIENRDFVAPFQEEIRRDYPLFEQDIRQQLQVQVGLGGPSFVQTPENLWRFQDQARNWRLSLVKSSLSFDVVKYTSRNDFLDRWTRILAAVEHIFDPQITLKIGMRYIDRIEGELLEAIDDMIKSDILGFAKLPLRRHVRHTLSEAIVEIEEGEMLLRWGILPANGTIDPNVLPPTLANSWILDIDVSSVGQRPFVASDLTSAFRALAERAYSVFRNMTTEKFLRVYGGTT